MRGTVRRASRKGPQSPRASPEPIIRSFPQKPLNGGMPMSDKASMSVSAHVAFVMRFRPPISSMYIVPKV